MPLPAVRDDDFAESLATTARDTAKSLESIVKGYKRDRMRVRALTMFAGRAQTVQGVERVRRKAQVEWSDRPEIELIIRRIHLIEANVARRDELKATMALAELKEHKHYYSLLAELDRQDQLHYSHIESVLASLAREFGQREATIANVAMKLAALAQQMLIAREEKGPKSEKDLLSELAQKYSMSVEEAKALLEAKDGSV